MTRRRLAYVSGPVDAVAMYRDFRAATHRHNFGTSYLKQLFALSEEHGFDLLVITTLRAAAYDTVIDNVTLVNMPMPASESGLGFHRAMARWARLARARILDFGADAVVLTAGQNYFFLFDRLRHSGVRIVLALHCVLFPKFGRRHPSWRVLQWLNARTVFRHASAIVAVSQDVIDQVEALTPTAKGRTAVFRPTYPPGAFAHVAAPAWPQDEPFRLLFVGRAEANKGVFLLAELARRLQALQPNRVHVDVCGGGSALTALQDRLMRDDLAAVVTLHGECGAETVRALYAQSHAVIVPTTSTFEEGYNKVCAEAVLAGRPVVTSAVCPALRDIAPAAIEVPPDDVDAYVAAVALLAADSERWRELADATHALSAQYYDPANSYGAVLGQRLRAAGLF